MNEEKPLHVKVAEALGWTEIRQEVWDIGGQKVPRDEWGGVLRDDFGKPMVWGRIGRYDADWSLTGPLLERFGIGVDPGLKDEAAHASTCIGACGEYCALPQHGRARIENIRMDPDRPFMACAMADTALEAACILIVALKAAGKLEPKRGAAAADAMRVLLEHEERTYKPRPE